MFDTRTRLLCFACLKDAARDDLKMRLRLPAPTNKKIGSGFGAALKVAAPAPQHWLQIDVLAVNNKSTHSHSKWGTFGTQYKSNFFRQKMFFTQCFGSTTIIMRIRIMVPTFLHFDPDPGGPQKTELKI